MWTKNVIFTQNQNGIEVLVLKDFIVNQDWTFLKIEDI